jgi:adenosylcobinamide-GDP ribazoletransferase
MRLLRERDRLICAVQMMTRLPTPAIAAFTPDMPTRAARYYPVAGWLVGAIAGLVFWGAARLGASWIAALLAVATSALVTGAFHEDGLADTADGLGGGQTPARRLEIMKDSRIGAFGALALVLVTGLRIAALARFPPVQGALVLLAVHSVARAAPIVLMCVSRHAGDPAEAKLPHADLQVSRPELAIAWSLALLPALTLRLPGLALAAAAAVAPAALVGLRAQRLIGGFTGDVLGCIEQLAEAAILVSLAWMLIGR